MLFGSAGRAESARCCRGTGRFRFLENLETERPKGVPDERNREYCEFIRQTEGHEYFICTPAEFQEIMADDLPTIRSDEWLRSCEENFLHKKLPQWWKQYGPHIRFHALQPHQQAWVLRIDPSQGQKSELSDAL